MLKKVCPVCGKIYYTDANASKYCSKECMKKTRMKKKPPVRTCVCKGCGVSFASVRRKSYCSEECRMYANGRGTDVYIKREKTKPRYTISEVSAMASAEGLSYGKYVLKYNL